MNIIAFAGTAGAGKDTAAAALEGYETVKFAGALKAMLEAFLRYQGCPEEMIGRYIEGDLKQQPCPYICGRTMRHAMKTLGTEWGREMIAKNIWTSAVENHIESNGLQNVTITDVRFHNEVDFVRERGGKVFRVDRGFAGSDTHPSEIDIVNLNVHDVIENTGSIGALHERVRRVAK